MGERAEWATEHYVPRVPSGEELVVLETEYCRRFDDLRKSRMCVSSYKYGFLADGYPERVDAIASLELRLQKYKETGNVEYLLDVGNFAMIEWMHPRHPEAHFKATDSDGSPGRIPANADLKEEGPTAISNLELVREGVDAWDFDAVHRDKQS